MAERQAYSAMLEKLGQKHARGLMKAATANTYTIGLEKSPKLRRVDISNKWAVDMQTIVEGEMAARGLPFSTHIIGIMRNLVKMAYIYGKDRVKDTARARLQEFYDIYEKYIDQWLAEYGKIRSVRATA